MYLNKLAGILVFIFMTMNLYYLILVKFRKLEYGERGDNGPLGNTGNKGPKGKKGLHGIIGPPGDPGESGDMGKMGPPGIRGPKGKRGYIGERGPRGENGYLGLIGDPGKRGSRGSPGSYGEPGKKGKKGIESNILSFDSGKENTTTKFSSYQRRYKNLFFRINGNMDWDKFVTGYKLKGNDDEDYAKAHVSKFKIVSKK